jgi:RNA polymerase sigma factor (sigma-70 family)
VDLHDAEPIAVTTFEEVYAEHHLAMTRLAYLVVGSRALAEEIVQESFTELLGRWSSVQQPGAYVRVVVVRKAVRVKERSRREIELATGTIERPPDPTNDDPYVESMWEALALLPARQRAAVVLRFYDELSNDEIATVLGITSANARLAVHRGIGRLRREVQTWTTE